MDTPHKIVLCKGTSGMGNRILAACTALLYGEIANRKVVIDWRDESYSETGENAFPKFFECPIASPVEALPVTDSVFPVIWQGNLARSLGNLQAELQLKGYGDMSFDSSRLDYAEDIIVFCAYTHKIPSLRPLFQGQFATLANMTTPAILRSVLDAKMHLVKEINDAIYGYKAKHFGANTIGVHVRYTDIKVPLDKIIGKVQQLVNRQRESVVFLATDSQEVITQFQAQFPRLVTTEKWFPPDGERMHQNWDHCPDRYQNGVEALTDLYLLSECNSLVFSSKSSFGYVSSLLSKASPQQIYDVEIDDSWMAKLKRKAKTLLQAK